ncbi:PmoA family protein [Streptomyces sp. NPDC050560]|uniref:PmoA family protein n=1 Tax=Streptomyces sp. NPDC050560 TaxID=3365630 RepID=UPI003794F026
MTRTPLPTGPVDVYARGRAVARYETEGPADPRLAPRPYLHPVRTLGGTVVTEALPDDHPHHLGACVALADVAGHNFWGGSTYVPATGPTHLANHGTQLHRAFTARTPGGFTELLDWHTAEGRRLLREERTLTALPLDARSWALGLGFTLTNTAGAPLSLGSSHTNGRRGAAYGGFFWRAPRAAAAPDVFTPTARGEAAVSGSRAPWLALAGDGWTLTFAAASRDTLADAWFVRAAHYPGVGSSLARERRLELAPGAAARRRVLTVVTDGRPPAGELAALVRAALAALPADPAVPGARTAPPS